MIYEEQEGFLFGQHFHLRRPRPDLTQEMIPDSIIDWICQKEKYGCKEKDGCIVCKYDIQRFQRYLETKEAALQNKIPWEDLTQ